MSRAGAGVERASQAEDAQMPMGGRPGVKKGVPIIEVDYGYLWSRAKEASDATAGRNCRRGSARWSPNLVASAL